MDKINIALLPVFPEYEIVEQGNNISLESGVYVHIEHYDSVDIYKLPVRNTFAFSKKMVPRDKQRVINYHLKNCLVTSKYYVLTPELVAEIPLMITVKKDDPHFLHIIHTQYP